MTRTKIIQLNQHKTPCKTPLCNLTWLQAQRYAKSGRGVVRLKSLMHRLTISELHSLAKRALSNATDDNLKTMRRWLVIACMAIQLIEAVKMLNLFVLTTPVTVITKKLAQAA